MAGKTHVRLTLTVDVWETGDSIANEESLYEALDAFDYAVVDKTIVKHECLWLPESMRPALAPLCFGEDYPGGGRPFLVKQGPLTYVSDGHAQYLVEGGGEAGNHNEVGTAVRTIDSYRFEPKVLGEPLRVMALDELPVVGERDSCPPPGVDTRMLGRTVVNAAYVEAALALFGDRGAWRDAIVREDYFDAAALYDGETILAIVMGMRSSANVRPEPAPDDEAEAHP